MDEQIDLKKIVLLITNGKWIILAFTLAGLTLSAIYAFNIKEVYLSEIRFEKIYVNNQISSNKVDACKNFSIIDFFYDSENFNQWQAISGDQSISFFDISQSYLTKDNETFLKPLEDHSVYFDKDRLIIKLTDINKINAFGSYLSFLNEIIKKNILSQITSYRDSITEWQKKVELNNTNSTSDNNYRLISALDAEIKNIENRDVYRIFPPTFPTKQKNNSQLIFGLLTLASMMLGIFIVVLRDSLSKK